MGLSVKVALLSCLGFTFGMCWLVSLVARPIVELPTPLVVRGPGARGTAATGAGSALETRMSSDVLAGRFERPSPLAVAGQARQRTGEALMVAEALPRDDDADVPVLPPLYVPEAPIVAEAKTPAVEPEIPEATVADGSPRGGHILAAFLPGAEADEVAEQSRSAGVAERVSPATKYRVKPGDTLVGIMRREWQSDDPKLLKVLLAANPQVAKRRNRIYPGEVLNIPALATRSSAMLAQAGGRSRSGEARRRGTSKSVAGVRWYTIRERDSLASIARRMLNDEGRWREIAELNRLRNAHKILPGARIKLPAPLGNET